MTSTSISAEEFDRRFDAGEELDEFFDVDNPAIVRADEPRRVNFNLPGWLVDVIDREAKHLAIPRQSVVIMWLADRAKQERLVV